MSVDPAPVRGDSGQPDVRDRVGLTTGAPGLSAPGSPEPDERGQRQGLPAAMLRLLMVDDHRMLTEALSVRLSMTPDLWVVGRLTTDELGFSSRVAGLRPDVVTVDVEPLGQNCRAVLDQLVQECPEARLVVLTSSRDGRYAADAVRAGATAWLSKEHGVEVLADVLRGVCQGHAWFPPDVLGIVLNQLRQDALGARHESSPLDVLSDREHDVLRGMAEGKKGARIAEELLISAQTVRTHTRSILAKLGVHSQIEAVSLARSAGLSSAAGDRTSRRQLPERAR